MFWAIKGGNKGQLEQAMQDNNVTGIGWNDLPDLSNIDNKDDLKSLYLKFHHTEKKMRLANHAGQIWAFLKEIQIGDLIALPLKRQSSVVIGRIRGNYKYKPDGDVLKHTRSVEWIKTIPRSEFDQDILYSLGAFMTVCRIKRTDEEKRVTKLLDGDNNDIVSPQNEIDENIDDEDTKRDRERVIRDQIIKYLQIHFRGHELTYLINEILQTKGFTTEVSSPGRDGGVDIFAGSGSLGLNSPKICVQVKSSKNPVDVRIVRELEGVTQRFKADYGLLVAWGGLTKTAEQEIKTSFFVTKAWDQGKIVDEVLMNYDKFSDAMKIKLPLKQIWYLAEDDDDS